MRLALLLISASSRHLVAPIATTLCIQHVLAEVASVEGWKRLDWRAKNQHLSRLSRASTK